MLSIRSILLGLLIFFPATRGFGHGEPIDVFVDSANRLVATGPFDSGEFVNVSGTLFTDLPGVQVSSPANGVASGTTLGYVVTQGLLFWDGTAVVEPAATLTVVPNVGPVYEVTADTTLQTGIAWGQYTGVPGWHSDGFYLLSNGAANGVYGLAVQLVAEGYSPSDPILVPFVHGNWNPTQIDQAINLLSAEVLATSNPDFNNDGQSDAADLARWSTGFGAATLAGHGQGDADGDGDVDGLDFMVWQREVALPALLFGSVESVPEPVAIQMALVLLLISTRCRFCGRESSARRRQ